MTAPIKVLLVEDNPGDARLILELLRETGETDFAIEQVDRLSLALEGLTRGGPDVILLDLGLPDSQGLETFERTRQAAPNEPIIVISGLDDEQTALKALRSGAQDYIIKGQIAGRLLVQVIRFALERKLSERALRESDERFRQLAENISEVFYVQDAQYRETLYINPAYEKIWGRSCQSLYENPLSFLDPIPAEDRERVVAYTARVQLGEDPGAVDFRVIQPDGTTRWERSHAVPIRKDGEVYRIAGVALDITELKQAEEALLESERRTRMLFDTVHLVVLGLDAAGNVDYVNPYFLEIAGYTLDEVLGQSWIDKFLPEQQRPTLRAAFRMLLDGQAHAHYENSIVTRAGAERMIAWNNTVLRDPQGQATGTLSIGEDITERNRLEEQFRQAQKMEAVGRLAGGIAHDFNNLLTVILGEIELILADSPSDIAFRPGLEEVKKSGERAAMLTRQLLAFSRRQLITPELMELNSVITDMSKMLGRLIGEDVAFQLRLSPAAGTVRVDRGQLEQVLANLVVNARDAMPHGGALTLSTSPEVLDEEYAASHADAKPGEYAMLAVSDSGTGMSDSVKARIFEPFFTTKEAGKGTGLGLAVSYGIIKQAGGHISAYSESGLGTTIKVYLPLVVAEEPLGTARVSPELPRGTETILIVEDEEAVRRVTMRILTRLGYRVLEARDAEDAKRVLSDHDGPVHLLFTDVVLPGIGGRELAEQIQLLRPQIKLLFASGYTDDVVLRHLLIERSAALLQKPFTSETIARAVRNALDS